MGRKAVPTSLKVLMGNPGKRPLNKNEPKPKPVAPPCPAWLPAKAKYYWRQVAPELERLGLLTAVDGPALAVALTHLAIIAEAAAIIKRDGILTTDLDHPAPDGTPGQRKHPANQLIRDSSAAFKQWVSEFGLTPAARVGLSLPEVDEVNDFAGLID